jgi:hypothetical protein
MTGDQQGKIPRVFISYSHDNSCHKSWVVELANRLCKNGVDVRFDGWDLRHGQDVAKFMEQSVSWADRVLMICTDAYVRKADECKGGVGYEAMIVTSELIKDLGTSKFIPIIRQNGGKADIPKFMGTRLFVNLSEAQNFDEGFEKLLRELHNTPLLEKPPVGANPFASNESLHCLIELDEKLSIIGGETSLILAIDEVAAELQAGLDIKVKVRIGNYSKSKSDLALLQAAGLKNNEDRIQAYQLRQVLEEYDIWDRRLDELLEEMVVLVIRNFRELIGFISKKELAEALQISFKLRFASPIVSGVKFDIFQGEDEPSFGIWLTEAQAEELAKQKGATDYRLLTTLWGLDLFDLPHDVLVKNVIPRMVYRYLWWKYEKKRLAVSGQKYFDFNFWRVGLG